MRVFGDRIAGISYIDRPGAYAVIKDPYGGVALVKTDRGYFLPGGGVEPGEELETALQREVLEETGNGILVGEKFATAVQYLYSKPDETYFKKIGHFYLASFTEKLSAPTEPDHELIWCSLDESVAKLAQEFQKWAVREELNLGR